MCDAYSAFNIDASRPELQGRIWLSLCMMRVVASGTGPKYRHCGVNVGPRGPQLTFLMNPRYSHLRARIIDGSCEEAISYIRPVRIAACVKIQMYCERKNQEDIDEERTMPCQAKSQVKNKV